MTPARLTLRLGDRDETVDVLDASHVRIAAEVREVRGDGVRLQVEGAEGGPAWVVRAGDSRWVYYDGCVYELEVQRDGGRKRTQSHGSLAAPMPATVRQIRVAAGDQVARGDTLIVLEAMKMELPVRASIDGTVAAIHCREGELVQPGRPLIDLAAKAGG